MSVQYVRSSHGYGWTQNGTIGGTPNVPGPIELYRPVEDGTEELGDDANFEVEFYGDFDTLEDAIDSIDCLGRWMISRPDEGKYIGYLNAMHGSVGLRLF